MSDNGQDQVPERGVEPTTMRFQGIGEPPVDPSAEAPAHLSGADQATVDALRAGTALLVVLRGPNTGARFLLDADEVSSGRHPDSDIFLDDVTVSRKHASFRREGDRFLVRDVGSLNGTYVNRERIDEAALKTGDEVQIGKFRLVFYAGTGTAP
jgi:pSer/pThr/pTyr-binding forkhead associated (FHA) protein